MKSFESVALIAFVLLCSFTFAQGKPDPKAKTVAERLGYPADSRLLVIHADDFGVSHTQNRATMTALEKGWITSASIMVPCPWFPEVARWAKQHPEADLGIHLVLNSEWTDYRWRPISPQKSDSSLLDADGYFPLLSEFVWQHAKPEEVETEARAQIDKAITAGIRPTHFDPHMLTIASTPELFKIYAKLGKSYGTPILAEKSRAAHQDGEEKFFDTVLKTDAVPIDRILGLEPGVKPEDWRDAYEKMLAPLPPGVYELIVHLAYNDEEMHGISWDHVEWGPQWRQSDVDLVSSPEFQKFLRDQKFILVNWKDLGRTISTK